MSEPEPPEGRLIIPGVTTCEFCGHLDDSTECECWEPMTEADVDSLYLEAWGLT